jgi:hypothetical protein
MHQGCGLFRRDHRAGVMRDPVARFGTIPKC